MQKLYLLILCCSTLNMCGAERGNTREKQNQETIESLKKNHAREVALYEQKIESLMTKIEQQNSTIQTMNQNVSRILRSDFDDK